MFVQEPNRGPTRDLECGEIHSRFLQRSVGGKRTSPELNRENDVIQFKILCPYVDRRDRLLRGWLGALKVCYRQQLRTAAAFSQKTEPTEQVLLAPGKLREIAIEQFVRIFEPGKHFQGLLPTLRAFVHRRVAAPTGCRENTL